MADSAIEKQEKMHFITDTKLNLDSTLDIINAQGKRVISKNGIVIGRIKEIRINPNNLGVDGVVVERGLFRKKAYIGKNYFDKLSHDALLLNIDPSILLKRKKVIDSEGKVAGKVKGVVRKGFTNDVDYLIVKPSLFRKVFDLDITNVKFIGRSVILKSNYNAPKKYIWNRT